MSKSKRKKQRGRRGKSARPSSRFPAQRRSRKLLDALIQVDRLIRRKEWEEAREQLEALDRRWPRRGEVLSRLTEVCNRLGDRSEQLSACERLASVVTRDPDVLLMLAGAYVLNVLPALALGSFRRFLERWPADPRSDEVRKTVADIQESLGEFLEDMGLTGEDRFETAALHEQIQRLLARHEYAEVRILADQLLGRRPDFLPPQNNAAEACFRQGEPDEAIATARRVLVKDPNNYHALSNLTRYLCLTGRTEEAKTWAERLKAVQSEAVDLWVKKAEALCFLGDDEGVLDALDAAQKCRRSDEPNGALLYHLAAAAAMRLGRDQEARNHWKQALRLSPGFELARENLDDLKRPVGQRHAPWSYTIEYWLPEKVIGDLAGRMESAAARHSDRAVTQQARKFLQKHPYITALVPMLLDRGDPAGREFAVQIAKLAETPELVSALREFALGQRGPDDLRLKAAQFLIQADALPPGKIRFWREGRWTEVLLWGFELHEEVRRVHSPEVESLGAEAIEALHERDGKRAEHFLKQALEIEPDAPDLLTNLAAAYKFQDRHEDARRLVVDVHERFPDYFFGRVNFANLLVQVKELDRAKELLEPLLGNNRMHLSEFAALCEAHIQLHLAEGNREAARRWLSMWEDVDPDHPMLKACRRRVLRRGAAGLLKRFLL